MDDLPVRKLCTINFNEKVYFTMTELGAGIAAEYDRAVNDRIAEAKRKLYGHPVWTSSWKTFDTTPDGRCSCTLWEFMEVFGPRLGVGGDPVTEDNSIDILM